MATNHDGHGHMVDHDGHMVMVDHDRQSNDGHEPQWPKQ